MTITNKSGTTIVVLGEHLKAGKTKRYNRTQGVIVVKSTNGCCTISITDQNKVSLKSEGNLKAQYGMGKDRNGHKFVNIISV